MIPISVDFYNKQTDEDSQWLKDNLPDSHELRAVLERQEMAKKYYAEVVIPNLPEDAWNG